MLMSTDMELSCDEKVLKEMNEDIKKPYANSLLSLATGRYIFNGNPLAFGEGNVKGRIKNVLNYKKPRFWVVVIAAIIAVAIGVGLLANPSVNSSMPRLITGYMVIEDDLLYVDEVEIIYREDTERIEELEKLGESITTPSGYHIYNPNTDKQTFKITKETTYTFVDYSFLFLEDGVEDRLYMTSNKEEFMLHLDESYYDSPPAQKVPFFIEVKDGKVISITEKIGFTI
jgi:hypothetical protein